MTKAEQEENFNIASALRSRYMSSTRETEDGKTESYKNHLI